MGNNIKGFEYESVVINAIREAGCSGNILEGAGASAAAADADFRFRKEIHLVEVKLTSKAQMGGSSVRFSKDGSVSLVKHGDNEVETLLLNAVNSYKSDLFAMLDRLSALEGREISKFPVQCSKDNWSCAQREGFLVNIKVNTDVNFIANHYRSKGVSYIQFGDLGLFHLGSNPANLPVPALKGSVRLEVRTARAGSKPGLAGAGRRVTGAIRVQARLSLGEASGYTLDNADSIRAMFKEADKF